MAAINGNEANSNTFRNSWHNWLRSSVRPAAPKSRAPAAVARHRRPPARLLRPTTSTTRGRVLVSVRNTTDPPAPILKKENPQKKTIWRGPNECGGGRTLRSSDRPETRRHLGVSISRRAPALTTFRWARVFFFGAVVFRFAPLTVRCEKSCRGAGRHRLRPRPRPIRRFLADPTRLLRVHRTKNDKDSLAFRKFSSVRQELSFIF